MPADGGLLWPASTGTDGPTQEQSRSLPWKRPRDQGCVGVSRCSTERQLTWLDRRSAVFNCTANQRRKLVRASGNGRLEPVYSRCDWPVSTSAGEALGPD